MDEKMMREVAEIAAEGSNKMMESLMFVLMAFISEMMKKEVFTLDDINRIFDDLEGVTQTADIKDMEKLIPLAVFRRMRRILISGQTAG